MSIRQHVRPQQVERLQREQVAQRAAEPILRAVERTEQPHANSAPYFYLQTGGQGDEHQLFGTRKADVRLSLALKHAGLLPQEHNLQGFLGRRNSAG